MNSSKASSGFALLFLMHAHGSAEGRSTAIAPAHGEIAFPVSTPGEHAYSDIMSSNGRCLYRLSLDPDPDTANNVVVIEITLIRCNDRDPDSNLLDPSNFFGSQPWTLAASDFVHGPAKSADGEVRTFRLQDLKILLRVRIVKAVVSPTNRVPGAPLPYMFKSLEITFNAQALE
jgi:hypothetical protein